jgi:hypothetical protein
MFNRFVRSKMALHPCSTQTTESTGGSLVILKLFLHRIIMEYYNSSTWPDFFSNYQ